MANGWQRVRLVVMKENDPTELVIWENKQFSILQFQGLYTVELNRAHANGCEIEPLPACEEPVLHAYSIGMRGAINTLATELHKALEDLHCIELETRDQELEAMCQPEVEAAERAAGWDPNP
jgi:hypothetical protein